MKRLVAKAGWKSTLSHNTPSCCQTHLESNIVAFLAVLHLTSPRGTFAVMHDHLVLVLVLVQLSENFAIAILVISHIISFTP